MRRCASLTQKYHPRPFPLRYRWTGREFDYESGLYFHRSRSYSPAQARFLQEDPSGWSGGGNLYAYADGAPAGARDPDGLSADYDMQPRPLHDQLPCMGTTQGCSSTKSYTAILDYGAGMGAAAFARMDRENSKIEVRSEGGQCTVYSSGRANLSRVQPEALQGLCDIAAHSGNSLGVYVATEGQHDDPRHAEGLAFDVNEIDGIDIGTGSTMNSLAEKVTWDVFGVAEATPAVRAVIGPWGNFRSEYYGGPRLEWDYPKALEASHQNHLHISFYSNTQRGLLAR